MNYEGCCIKLAHLFTNYDFAECVKLYTVISNEAIKRLAFLFGSI